MPQLENKRIVITGGTGMIGQYLLEKLLNNYNLKDIKVLSIDDRQYVKHRSIQYVQTDLRDMSECKKHINKNTDIVFHLAGIKGSPKLTKEQPASFFVSTIQFNTNVLEAAKNCQWILYTSSVGVYGPAEVFYEDDCWKQFPSENDKFAGWAKRMGELQLEAYAIEFGKKNYSIVRPMNVYGKFDNFNLETCMVIPALIAKASALPDGGTLEVWGDGSAIRDLVHSEDVANSMIQCVEKEITEPINISGGQSYTIKNLVDEIVRIFANEHNKHLSVQWLHDKPSGDRKRIANTDRAKSYDILSNRLLSSGLSETINWYLENRETLKERYDVFSSRE